MLLTRLAYPMTFRKCYGDVYYAGAMDALVRTLEFKAAK